MMRNMQTNENRVCSPFPMSHSVCNVQAEKSPSDWVRLFIKTDSYFVFLLRPAYIPIASTKNTATVTPYATRITSFRILNFYSVLVSSSHDSVISPQNVDLRLFSNKTCVSMYLHKITAVLGWSDALRFFEHLRKNPVIPVARLLCHICDGEGCGEQEFFCFFHADAGQIG